MREFVSGDPRTPMLDLRLAFSCAIRDLSRGKRSRRIPLQYHPNGATDGKYNLLIDVFLISVYVNFTALHYNVKDLEQCVLRPCTEKHVSLISLHSQSISPSSLLHACRPGLETISVPSSRDNRKCV